MTQHRMTQHRMTQHRMTQHRMTQSTQRMFKAFYIDQYGGPEVLQWGEFPSAPLGPRDIRLQIHAASINPLDFLIREGKVKPLLPYTFPLIMGNDCAGVVTEVGQEVRRFKVGDAVYTRLPKDRIGAFAEEVVTAEGSAAHKPERLSFVEAASMPLVLLTAYQFLTEAAKLRAGQSVLIHAGAGAVGSAAIQLAKYLGLQVTTTVSARNIPLVRDFGADQVIDRRAQDFAAVVRGMDGVLDSVGMDNLLKSFRTVKPGGTVVSISAGPDVAVAQQMKVTPLLWPVFWLLSAKPRAAARKAGANYRYLFMRADGAQLESLNPLLEHGTVRPHLDRVFPFEQTAQALAYAESGAANGKVVIQMRHQ